MEETKVITCNDTSDKYEAIDFELVECESVEATTSIMGLPRGPLMEAVFYVYRC
jgi:hypothetical protein